MSAPTRIYLVLVSLIAMVWIVGAYVVGAGSTLVYRGDARYLLQNANRLTAVVRGRIVLRDGVGAPRAVPPSTLSVSVLAREMGGAVAVRKVAPVDEHGLFEVSGLPEGEATVAVHLGGGVVVWQADGIAVGRSGVFDERLDPIDLGDRLFPLQLTVFGPDGEPTPAGHLLWRTAGGATDDRSFEGDAPIADGGASLLTTAEVIDVVTLVPGAATELFEGVWRDGRIDLAPGVTARLRPTGRLPSEEEWTLQIALAPEDLAPRLEYDEDAILESGALIARVEDGTAELPLARGGRYHISWWAVPAHGHRFRTLQISGRPATIDVPTAPGLHVLDVPFPMDEFARGASEPR